MATKNELENQITKLLGELTGYQRGRELENQVRAAINDVEKAIAAINAELNVAVPDTAAVETKLRGMRASVELLMERKAVGNWVMQLGGPFFGGAALALVIIGMLFAVGYMVIAMGAPSWQTIAGGRAVLLLALTLTFITFGGALLISPLYASEPLEERFRRSREVFLLFAGMFSTVVGFYFATADNKFLGSSILIAESFDPTRGELQVAVAGGKPPYVIEVEAGEKGAIKKPPQSLEEPGTVTFNFAKSEWPTPIKIKVRDAAAGKAERMSAPSVEELNRGSFSAPKESRPSLPDPAAKANGPPRSSPPPASTQPNPPLSPK